MAFELYVAGRERSHDLNQALKRGILSFISGVIPTAKAFAAYKPIGKPLAKKKALKRFSEFSQEVRQFLIDNDYSE